MLDLTKIDDAIRYEGGITRRLLLAYGASLAAIPTLDLRAEDRGKKKANIPSDVFKLGVASGDPNAVGFVIWTRLAPEPLNAHGGMPGVDVEVHWNVATDEKMKNVVGKEKTVVAKPDLGHSVHVEVENLQPDRWYWYQFRCGDEKSPIGRARTMPRLKDDASRLQFALASCQHFEEGYFTAYKHMAQDELDLVFFLGDYIYEFGAHKGRVREHQGDKCQSLAEYRVRHCQYRSDPLLQKMHARCPWVVTWDDHEVEGNYANDISKNIEKGKSISKAEFLKRRAHAYQAYYEMMPLRPSSVPKVHDMLLYRTVRFGHLASFQVLDTRQYRTNQPNGDDSSEINDAAKSPKNTLLGPEQKKWLEGQLRDSKATWNVLAQQVMMGMVDRESGKQQKYSMDAWPGYFYERKELIRFLEKGVKNPIVLTGDIHSNWVNDLREDDRDPKLKVVATEFVCTSLTSGGHEKTEVEPQKVARLKRENPCVKFHNHQRGYVRCTVTRKEWKSDFQVVDDVTKKDGKVSTVASFVVEAGRAGSDKA